MMLPARWVVITSFTVMAIVDTAAITSSSQKVNTPIDWIVQNLALFLAMIAASVAYGSLKQRVQNQETMYQGVQNSVTALSAKLDTLSSTMAGKIDTVTDRKVSREELLTITGNLQSQMASLHGDMGMLVNRIDRWAKGE